MISRRDMLKASGVVLVTNAMSEIKPLSGFAVEQQDSNAGSLTYRGNAARTGEMPGPGLSLDHRIVVASSFETADKIGRFPAIHDGILYVGSLLRFHAFSTETNREIWSVDIKGSYEYFPVYHNGIIYTQGAMGSDWHTMHALNATNGRVIWKSQLGYFATPAVAGDVMYVPSEGTMTSVNASTGATVWGVEVAGRIDVAPAVFGDVLVFCVWEHAGDSSLRVVDSATGAERWRKFVPGTPFSTPVIGGGYIYHNDGTDLKAFDVKTGQEIWSHHFGFTILSLDQWYDPTPAVADGKVYIGYGDSLLALNAETGKVVWEFEAHDDIHSSPAVSEGIVYFSSDSYLRAIDCEDGDQIWSYWSDKRFGSPGVVDGVLYVAVGDNKIGTIANSITRMYFKEDANIYRERTSDSEVLATAAAGEYLDSIDPDSGYWDDHEKEQWFKVTVKGVVGWTNARIDQVTSNLMGEVIYDPQ